MSGNRILIHGGYDGDLALDDVHIFTLFVFLYFDSWHASCTLSGNRILIHGGYDGDLALDDVHIFTLGMDKLYITL